METPGKKLLDDEIRAIGKQAADGLGLELVDLSIGRARTRWRIRLDIDRAGPTGVGIEDCQRVSRQVETVLDERDLVPGSYVLEVSSPGIDRPIRTVDDVRRNTGRRVVVQTREPLEGRRSFSGTLEGLRDDVLELRSDGGEQVRIPLGDVALARQEVEF